MQTSRDEMVAAMAQKAAKAEAELKRAQDIATGVLAVGPTSPTSPGSPGGFLGPGGPQPTPPPVAATSHGVPHLPPPHDGEGAGVGLPPSAGLDLHPTGAGGMLLDSDDRSENGEEVSS